MVYLAYDQIRRKAPTWANIKDPVDIRKMIESLDELVKFGPGVVRPSWRTLPSRVTKLPKEIILSVIETLQQTSSFIPTPQLRVDRWIPMVLINGTCELLGYSIWSLDPEDQSYNWLQDGPRSRGGVTTFEEWLGILGRVMMTGRNNHFHVRESNLQSQLKESIDRVILRLARQVGISADVVPLRM